MAYVFRRPFWPARRVAAIGAFTLPAAAPQTLAVDPALATLTAHAPALVAGAVSISVPAATATFSAQAPTVVTGAVSVAVPAAVATFTAQAPSVIAGAASVSVPAATVQAVAVAPTVVPGAASVSVTAITATLSAFAPAPLASATVAVPAASLIFTAHAPGVTVGAVALAVPAASGAFTTHAPAILPGSVSLAVPAASLTLTAHAPSVAAGAAALAVPAASMVLTAHAPAVSVGAAIVAVPAAVAMLSAHAPAVIAEGGAQTIIVPVASITATAHAPAVVPGAVSVNPSTTFVQDTFTAADGTLLQAHTPEIGAVWTKVWGANSEILSNSLRPLTSPFPSLYVNASLPATGYEMSLFFYRIAAGINGFYAHRQPAVLDGYVAGYRDGTHYMIGTVIGGVITELVSLYEAGPSFSTLMLRVRQGDDYLRLLVDGVEKLATDDQTFTDGEGGLWLHGFGTETVADDFVAVGITAVVVLSAHAPGVTVGPVTLAVPAVAAAFSAQAPTVVPSAALAVPSASIVATAHAPAVSSGATSIVIQPALVVFTAHAPTVIVPIPSVIELLGSDEPEMALTGSSAISIVAPGSAVLSLDDEGSYAPQVMTLGSYVPDARWDGSQVPVLPIMEGGEANAVVVIAQWNTTVFGDATHDAIVESVGRWRPARSLVGGRTSGITKGGSIA